MKKLILLLILLQACQFFKNDGGQLILIEADKSKGFHFPYFLFIPDSVNAQNEIYLIVEPNNSGFADDDLSAHLEKAERTAGREYYIGNYIARKLNYPLLVPVFPRRESSWKIYTHALDRDAILQKGNDLERLDLQLLNMVTDAGNKLLKMGYKINDKFLMTGFSASGTFVNRFTVIHPEHILAAAAGGLNGLLMLPEQSLNNQELNYPLGTFDFEKLFNKEFDSAAFKETAQFYFMGELDDNDAIPYADGYDENERKIIFEQLGQEMQPQRWNKCVRLYQEKNINAKIRTYKNLGHSHPDSVKNDILTFFRKNTKP